jgi:hypothetical protein
MMAPACLACKVEMRCVKTGAFVELVSDGSAYQVWSGDVFECPSCGAQVVAQYGRSPVVESHEPHYATVAERAICQVAVS